jgi:rubrerythrin
MLTSATLGDESANHMILSFASRLCGDADFLGDSIIRAQREDLPEAQGDGVISPKVFKRLVEIIDEDGRGALHQITAALASIEHDGDQWKEADSYQTWLYEVLKNDPFTYAFRKMLQEETPTIPYLCDGLDITPEELKDFIVLANFAEKGSSKLLDIRYHHFIRTLEGAYVTFKPHKTLTVKPRNEVEINDQKYKCFKISVCQYCGEIYLIGSINKKVHKFDQSLRNSGSYFMLVDEEFLETRTDEDGNEDDYLKGMYTLCCKCGSIYPSRVAHPTGKCSCGETNTIKLFEVKPKDGQMVLHRCEYCKSTNPRGSIIRGFYIGQNAAAAVIGSSLYEQMPIKKHEKTIEKAQMGKTIEKVITKETKQLLIFSDSRQDAAYFAPFFQFTYQNIIRRRILMQAAETLCASYPHRIPFMEMVGALAQLLEIHGQTSPANAKKEAWKVLLYEMRGRDRNGLVNLGLISFTADSEFDEGYEQFTKDELVTIDTLLMEGFLQESAISFPQSINFTEEDYKYFSYRGNRAGFLPGVKNKEIVIRGCTPLYWLAKTSNSRIDFLTKIEQFSSKEDILSFLNTFWEAKEDTYLDCMNSVYSLNPERIYIRVTGYHDQDWYICDVCGRTTSKNYKNVCPHFRCKGILSKMEPGTLKKYHTKHLTGSSLFPMKVEEHTAQLSHQRAANYQEAFIDGDINVLSSSTTFEMGVDVGDLETIFMRNMPPNPSNYIQRAGRAGRRSDSAAYALTFCRLSNHDLTFFNQPERMINGLISPPVFKVDNEKIVRRHVYAALFAAFWRHHPSIEKISEFMEDEIYEDYLSFLKHIDSSTWEYIQSFIPESLPPEILNRYVEELYEGEEILVKVRADYLNELSHIKTFRDELITEGNKWGILSNLERVENSIKATQIIAFLSRKNLIPKYGFPVDTVELRTDLASLNSYQNNSNLRLQRDLFQAITDYAPGAEIIADGMMYTSRYIKRPHTKNHDWSLYDYAICSNPECGKITVKRHLGEEEVSGLIHSKCPNCGSDFKRGISQTFIVPQYGFIVSTDQPVPVTVKKPRRMARTQILYVGDEIQVIEESIRKYRNHGIRLVVTTSKDDELAIINRSSFFVCKSCGYAVDANGSPTPFKTKKHKNPYGKICYNNKLVNLTLGHTFKTDVTKIVVDAYLEDDRAYTILYSFLEGLSTFFDIERNDIDGCLQRVKGDDGQWSTVFILFDKVPGGAGNANRIGRLSEATFQAFMSCCLGIVSNCDCGDEGDGNAACYSCLCNYGNQYFHEILKRKYAIEFFSQFLGIQTSDQHEKQEVEVDLDIRELTDHEYDYLLDKLGSIDSPEAYYELSLASGECIGQADLAWPKLKIAIIEDIEKEIWEAEGWKVIPASAPKETMINEIKKFI